MVKTPNMRHSKPHREPVTIDLQAESVENANQDEAAKSAEAARPAAAAPGVTPQAKPIEAETAPQAKPSDAQKPEFGRDAGAAAQTAAGSTARRAEEPAQTAAPKDSPKPEPKSSIPPRPPVSEPPRRGAVSALTAGLIGGVVALAGGAALQWAGVLPSLGGNNQAALESRINELQSQVAALPVPVDYTGRLDALDSQVKQAMDAVSAGGADAAQAIEQRFKAIEDGLAAANSAIAAAPAAAVADLAPVNDRLTSVETAVQAVNSTLAAAGDRIGALEKSVGEISGKVAEQAEQPKAALAIAASALKAAIERGEPFVTEIDTFAAIAPPSPEIDQLRQMAAAGVASRATIEAAFPAAASAMVSAGKAQDPNAGFFDKLVSSAQSLVDVRPVGMVEGEGAAEIVARMEVHLKNADYAAAIAEYDKLPEAAKTAGASFIGLVKARQTADALSETILANALKA
jgi:hypothetical protein